MTRSFNRTLAVIGLCASVTTVASAQRTKALDDYLPDAGVPQITTLEGAFVRAAHNNEGYVVLGYRAANGAVGEPWMLLDVGIALLKGQKTQKITRDRVTLVTPDDRTIPLPSNEEYVAANPTAIEYRAYMSRDPLAFPGDIAENVSCRGGSGPFSGTFFYDFGDTRFARVNPPLDGPELDPRCTWMGRLYFPIRGGIGHGQYWLNVAFAGSLVRVPFRVMTKAEEATFAKNYKSIKKQAEQASREKK